MSKTKFAGRLDPSNVLDHHGSSCGQRLRCQIPPERSCKKQEERALYTAIVHPAPKAGPSRRPQVVCVAWRMRHMADQLRRVGEAIGVHIEVESRRVAEGIAAAHGTSIDGINH